VCYKVHYFTKDKTINQYTKSCGPKSYCEKEANPSCKTHLGESECEIKCCEENMCNAGSVTVSGIIVATSAFVAMVLLKK